MSVVLLLVEIGKMKMSNPDEPKSSKMLIWSKKIKMTKLRALTTKLNYSRINIANPELFMKP